MSTRLVGPHKPGARLSLLLRGWLLIVLFLNAACATGVPRGGLYRPPTPHFHEAAQSPTAEAEAEEVEESEVSDELVRLSLPTRFGAVQVSDFELNEALTTLVLNMPLRVAGSHVPLYLHRKLALASVPLTGEEWRTPLARSYGGFCERRGTSGDCLELFKDGPGLDGEDKRDIALALSLDAALEARDAQLRGMFSTTQLWTTLSLTIIGYMALVAAPEPVSKGVAAALALLMWGYLGWELFDLVRAWFQLWEEAAEASTFAELREAGDRFGKVIGPNSVRILLLLGTAAVGETAALVSKAPTLPGFAKAAGALKSHAGIRDVLTAVQEADKVKVAVAEGTFSVVLPANVLSMAARGAPARADPPKKKPDVHHIATVENEKSTLRGGPWTQRFRKIFDKAGMSMEDPANKSPVVGHKGHIRSSTIKSFMTSCIGRRKAAPTNRRVRER